MHLYVPHVRAKQDQDYDDRLRAGMTPHDFAKAKEKALKFLDAMVLINAEMRRRLAERQEHANTGGAI